MIKVITIGRSSENDIVINDAKVSRTHIQLVQNDSGVCSVVDLNSANGTFVNGKKISGEERLQENDSIRIGDTTLSWQEYIKQSCSVEQAPQDIVNPTKKTNRRWWYVTACIVLVVLVGGIVFYIYYNRNVLERIEDAKRSQEEIQKEQLRQDAEHKAAEAKRLQSEADELFRQDLILQSDESRALAEAKQQEATKAKEQAEEAAAAQRKAETARVAAEKAKEEAEKAKTTAEQNSKKAIKNAEEKADQAVSKANMERDYANVKAKLTEKFYEEYALMNSDFAKRLCKQLKLNDRNDAKTAIKDSFNQSDNKGKQDIIDAIEVVKHQNSKSKAKGSVIKSDTLKASKHTETVDD